MHKPAHFSKHANTWARNPAVWHIAAVVSDHTSTFDCTETAQIGESPYWWLVGENHPCLYTYLMFKRRPDDGAGVVWESNRKQPSHDILMGKPVDGSNIAEARLIGTELTSL